MKKKWDRKLGTSKREQGIKTSKCPPFMNTMARHREREKKREPTMEEMMNILKARG